MLLVSSKCVLSSGRCLCQSVPFFPFVSAPFLLTVSSYPVSPFLCLLLPTFPLESSLCTFYSSPSVFSLLSISYISVPVLATAVSYVYSILLSLTLPQAAWSNPSPPPPLILQTCLPPPLPPPPSILPTWRRFVYLSPVWSRDSPLHSRHHPSKGAWVGRLGGATCGSSRVRERHQRGVEKAGVCRI